MKSFLKYLSVAFFACFILASCSKDDDPADNDFFAGTYHGTISYTGGDSGGDVSSMDGSVTVTKIASGTKYNFAFSNGIPNLNGIEFEKKGDNVLINVGGQDGINFIKVDADHLEILYLKGGKKWTADCDR